MFSHTEGFFLINFIQTTIKMANERLLMIDIKLK